MNRNLPASISDLAALIGEQSALRLAARYPGRRLYIPAAPPPDHAITRIIGQDAARRLAERHGGQAIDIPMLRARAIRQRNRLILRDAERMSLAELAARWHLSRRQIINILSRAREEEASCND